MENDTKKNGNYEKNPHYMDRIHPRSREFSESSASSGQGGWVSRSSYEILWSLSGEARKASEKTPMSQ